MSTLKRVLLLLFISGPLSVGAFYGAASVFPDPQQSPQTVRVCRGLEDNRVCHQVPRTLTDEIQSVLIAAVSEVAIIMLNIGLTLLIVRHQTALYIFDKTSNQLYYLKENLFRQKLLETLPLEMFQAAVCRPSLSNDDHHNLFLTLKNGRSFYLGATSQAKKFAKQINHFVTGGSQPGEEPDPTIGPSSFPELFEGFHSD